MVNFIMETNNNNNYNQRQNKNAAKTPQKKGKKRPPPQSTTPQSRRSPANLNNNSQQPPSSNKKSQQHYNNGGGFTSAPSTPRGGYAGSKCYEPPVPRSLPRPKWSDGEETTGPRLKPGQPITPFQRLVTAMQEESERREDSRNEDGDKVDGGGLSQHLKLLLKVQA